MTGKVHYQDDGVRSEWGKKNNCTACWDLSGFVDQIILVCSTVINAEG